MDWVTAWGVGMVGMMVGVVWSILRMGKSSDEHTEQLLKKRYKEKANE